jgi:leader peptidase (prepilin peptidase) / N-methyltransferase
MITLYTDIRYMLISRFVTLYSIPLAMLLSYYGKLPLSPLACIIGAFSGFTAIWAVAYLFYIFTKKEGLGQGDVDLIAFIGAFTGFVGWWSALMIGSCTASLYGITYMLVKRNFRSVKLPFGPFLVIGAILYVLFQETIFVLLFS